MEPLMLAGHWMPDLCAHAGLRAVGVTPGGRSPTVAWEAIRDADPDVLAVMPCGFHLDATRRDLGYLTARPGWGDLTAVRTGRVALLDGNAYFNRPGPRLVRAAELLAHVAHDVPLDPPPAPWEVARLDAARSA
jgi:iron complex transport system substrate-binding protein